jgi:two-component system OmpR family sensor kinase
VKPLGLRAKLNLYYATVFALALAGLALLSYQTLAVRLDQSVNEELEEMAAGLRGYLHFRQGVPQLDYREDDPEEAYFIHTSTRFFQVYRGEGGALLVQSRELDLLGLDISPGEVQELVQRPRFTDVKTPSGWLRFHNDVVSDEHNRPYLVQVGASLEPIHATLNKFLETLLLLVPVWILAAAGGGWWMARKALQPVEAVTHAAREISISRLDRRLPLHGSGDELDRLAETFNEVFARLDDAVRQMRQFTASVSHELRTPLTAMRGEAEVALLEAGAPEDYRRVLASQLEEFDKLTHMINGLLTLARAEAGEIPLSLQSVDLSALVSSLAEQMEPVAKWKKLTFDVKAGDKVSVTGDPHWLERVLLNLLDNAIKFTPEGGRVEIRVLPEDNYARIDVRDTGVGIASEAIPHIFESFYRADPSRSKQVEGAGLGLSLVRWIVEQHGGTIQVESQPGQGSCFSVRLPLPGLSAPADT